MDAGGFAPWIGAVSAMGIGAAALYYSSGGSPLETVVDINEQSTEVLTPDRGRITRQLKDGQLLEYLDPEVRTLYGGFRRGAKLSDNGDCLGYRKQMADGTASPYMWIRYNDVLSRAEQLAAGFLDLGISPGQSSFIGLYAVNRPEWIYVEQACYVYSMVLVPLYDTLGPDACSFILDQADIKLVVCDQSKKAEALLGKHSSCLSLKFVVLMEEASETLLQKGRECGVEVLGLDALIKRGADSQKSKKIPHQPPQPEDLATICYTSGTTGPPKGVMLTHGNIIADCTCMFVLKHTKLVQEDIMISYLPLAHMFERLLEACSFMVGARVGFFRGDVKLLSDDIKELRPTVVPTVPRLLNRIYDKVMQEVSKSSFKKFLFDWAMQSKEKDLKKSIIRSNTLWDKLVFKRVREGMGGRVKLMVTGSAPLSENVLTFMRAALGCVVLEGYGQTECVAACSVTVEGDNTPGHVGPPLPCCIIKMVDVPEMNYFAKDGAGEVCIKGPTVFKGYYKDAEKTAEALDADGWLHTGDIGRWTPQGTIKLVDRKKHIFKLAQGEYIAPEKIENVYQQSKFVGQIYVHGESLKSCLVAIVVPDPDVLPKHVEKELGLQQSMEELCRNETVKKLILEDILACGKKGGLHSFEQVKDIYLHPELFTVEGGLLTPTMKSKRPALKEYFKDQMTAMYRNLE